MVIWKMIVRVRSFVLLFGGFLANIYFVSGTPQTSLEYKPIRPSFSPSGSHTTGQLIPPGPPWPDSVEGYQNFSSITKPPMLADRLPDLSPTTQRNPNVPSFAGSSDTHKVPPGKPWPDSAEGYHNFSVITKPTVIVDRLPEVSTDRNPNKPSFAGATFINGMVPSGKPWPDSIEGYLNFTTQKPTRLPNSSTPFIDLFYPLVHTTSNPDLFTTTTMVPPTIEDPIPPKSEIPMNPQPQDLNNLDFFKPQFKPVDHETFFRPFGIDHHENNHRKTTMVPETKPPMGPSVIINIQKQPMGTTTKKTKVPTRKPTTRKPNVMVSSLLPPEALEVLEVQYKGKPSTTVVPTVTRPTTTEKTTVLNIIKAPATVLLPPKYYYHNGGNENSNNGNINFNLGDLMLPQVFVFFDKYDYKPDSHENFNSFYDGHY
ncbi:unnamed protein product [Brassicogethes aeneus]|uniref:Uncharacterized protein n=1 Tax=Brassicogethes aeneus TaxID=1431903 RepID=A0A9P0BJR0_BRAAE|nr:unnamed protein product [Brassicogethes aeneus]